MSQGHDACQKVLTTNEILHRILLHCPNPSLSAALRLNKNWFDIAGSILYGIIYIEDPVEVSGIYSRFPPRQELVIVDFKGILLQHTRMIGWDGSYFHPPFDSIFLDRSVHPQLTVLHRSAYRKPNVAEWRPTRQRPAQGFKMVDSELSLDSEIIHRLATLGHHVCTFTLIVRIAYYGLTAQWVRIHQDPVPPHIRVLLILNAHEYVMCGELGLSPANLISDQLISTASSKAQRCDYYFVNACSITEYEDIVKEWGEQMRIDWPDIELKVREKLSDVVKEKEINFKTRKDYLAEGWGDEVANSTLKEWRQLEEAEQMEMARKEGVSE